MALERKGQKDRKCWPLYVELKGFSNDTDNSHRSSAIPNTGDSLTRLVFSQMKLLAIFNTPALKCFAFQVGRGGKEITEMVTKTCF